MSTQISIQCISLDDSEQRTHVILRRLCILEHIAHLLVIDARDAEEEGGLQAQGHRRVRVDDRVACFLDVDVEDLLLVHFDVGGLRADGGDEPVGG